MHPFVPLALKNGERIPEMAKREFQNGHRGLLKPNQAIWNRKAPAQIDKRSSEMEKRFLEEGNRLLKSTNVNWKVKLLNAAPSALPATVPQ